MKKVQGKKLLRLVVAVCTVAMLICSMATTSLAVTSTEWTTNAGRESLINKVSNEEFSIIGPKAAPTEIFSFDPSTTAPNTSISTNDISFTVQIEAGAEPHGDFYGLFAMRISNPSVGVWGGNTALSVQFDLQKIVLRRWAGGMIDVEKEVFMDYSVVDGAEHNVNIKVEDYTVTVTVDDQTMSMTYDYFPGSGGYQFMAYNSTVHVRNFEDGTTPSAPVDPQPTEPQETQPVKPENTQPVKPQDTKPAGTEPAGPTEPADPNGDSTLYIVAGVVVGVCVIAAVVYFVVSRKKK